VLLVFGIGVGVVAGLVGAVLALPSVPEFADQPSPPPMLYGLHTVPVFLVVAVAVVVLAVVVAISSVNLLRVSRFKPAAGGPCMTAPIPAVLCSGLTHIYRGQDRPGRPPPTKSTAALLGRGLCMRCCPIRSGLRIANC
jgi:hypothetical protein